MGVSRRPKSVRTPSRSSHSSIESLSTHASIGSDSDFLSIAIALAARSHARSRVAVAPSFLGPLLFPPRDAAPCRGTLRRPRLARRARALGVSRCSSRVASPSGDFVARRRVGAEAPRGVRLRFGPVRRAPEIGPAPAAAVATRGSARARQASVAMDKAAIFRRPGMIQLNREGASNHPSGLPDRLLRMFKSRPAPLQMLRAPKRPPSVSLQGVAKYIHLLGREEQENGAQAAVKEEGALDREVGVKREVQELGGVKEEAGTEQERMHPEVGAKREADTSGAAGADASLSGPGAAGADASLSGPGAAGADASLSGPGAAGADASLSGPGAAGADASLSGPGAAGADVVVSVSKTSGSSAMLYSDPFDARRVFRSPELQTQARVLAPTKPERDALRMARARAEAERARGRAVRAYLRKQRAAAQRARGEGGGGDDEDGDGERAERGRERGREKRRGGGGGGEGAPSSRSPSPRSPRSPSSSPSPSSMTRDPFRTLFVARLPYEVTERALRRAFEPFGPIERVAIVVDASSGLPRGYAFVEFERAEDMKEAYKEGDGTVVGGRATVVDVERGRTVEGWLPTRLGGGLGGEARAERLASAPARAAARRLARRALGEPEEPNGILPPVGKKKGKGTGPGAAGGAGSGAGRGGGRSFGNGAARFGGASNDGGRFGGASNDGARFGGASNDGARFGGASNDGSHAANAGGRSFSPANPPSARRGDGGRPDAAAPPRGDRDLRGDDGFWGRDRDLRGDDGFWGRDRDRSGPRDGYRGRTRNDESPSHGYGYDRPRGGGREGGRGGSGGDRALDRRDRDWDEGRHAGGGGSGRGGDARVPAGADRYGSSREDRYGSRRRDDKGDEERRASRRRDDWGDRDDEDRRGTRPRHGSERGHGDRPRDEGRAFRDEGRAFRDGGRAFGRASEGETRHGDDDDAEAGEIRADDEPSAKRGWSGDDLGAPKRFRER